MKFAVEEFENGKGRGITYEYAGDIFRLADRWACYRLDEDIIVGVGKAEVRKNGELLVRALAVKESANADEEDRDVIFD